MTISINTKTVFEKKKIQPIYVPEKNLRKQEEILPADDLQA